MTREEAIADLTAAGAERVEFDFNYEHASGIAVFRGQKATAARVNRTMTPGQMAAAVVLLKQWLRKQG